MASTTDSPDLKVSMDDLLDEGEKVIYKWTLEGINTGPGELGIEYVSAASRNGGSVPMARSAESEGHFDSEEYQRQIEHGV